MHILSGDFNHPQVKDLLAYHLKGMQANTAEGHVFALDWSGLQKPDISFYAVWDGERVAGCGALKQLDAKSGELKSMRTHPDFLRKGVGQFLMEHLIGEARSRGYTRLSLETGSADFFEPACALYRKNGFVSGGAFADYVKSPYNQFMHRDL